MSRRQSYQPTSPTRINCFDLREKESAYLGKLLQQ
jgi:hypothetical protein